MSYGEPVDQYQAGFIDGIKANNAKLKSQVGDSVLGALLVYATRYAMSRQTYASAEVARYIVVHGNEIPQIDRSTLVKDIQDALLTHKVDPYSTGNWREALEVLTKGSDLLTTNPDKQTEDTLRRKK